MSGTPEPLAAILAEMRYRADNHRHDGWESVGEELDDLADRIEAAAERETQNAMKTAFLTKCQVCEKFGPTAAPGNAAAMRAVLNSIDDIAEDAFGGPWRHREALQGYALSLIIDAARAALAAPARNCDVGTAEEQIKRFETFCNKSFDCGVPHGNCGACPLWTSGTIGHDCEMKWAQMPYAPAEGGDHA